LNTESKNNIPVVLLFGPTAVGKTECIFELHKHLPIEVLNADSMQIYKGMDIGTAKPTLDEQKKVPHHLIDLKLPNEQYTVGEFVRLCDEEIPRIRERGNLPVVAGGTAFYIYHFLYGLPNTPPRDLEMRKQIYNELEEKGPEKLFNELCSRDPSAADSIAVSDTYRLTRALEVIRKTGKALSSFGPEKDPRQQYRFLIIGLYRERRLLYERINRRVELMFETGLISEIKNLLSTGYTFTDAGMRAIGYREFFTMLLGCFSFQYIKKLIQRNSRRFAKRQITFFKRIPDIHWQNPEDSQLIIDLFYRHFSVTK